MKFAKFLEDLFYRTSKVTSSGYWCPACNLFRKRSPSVVFEIIASVDSTSFFLFLLNYPVFREKKTVPKFQSYKEI